MAMGNEPPYEGPRPLRHHSLLFNIFGIPEHNEKDNFIAHKVGSYAFTHRNRKNKKNVPLETHPDNVTR